MPRRIFPGRSYNPASRTTTPSYSVERDATRASFDTEAEAKAWRDRLDGDLADTATRAWNATNH